MLVKRIYEEKLAQVAYLVACQDTGAALIVDPLRDTERYIAAAAAEKVKITHVAETHIHADFVSGARALAAATGARLLLSDAGGIDWKYDYAAEAQAEPLTDGSSFMVGDVRVDAEHTPGHTPEHLTFFVTDTATASAPMGALTGDFIFVGDVGRPDLLERAVGREGTMKAAAGQLYRSLRRFERHPDYLQLWPGHGAGSACGKALGAMPQSTLGYEKHFNWAFNEAGENEFVKRVLEGQPAPPAYFAVMKRVNKAGPSPLRRGAATRLTPDELRSALSDPAGSVVVDSRPASDFAGSHSRGSINLPHGKSFLTWAGALLPYDANLALIVAHDEHQSIIDDLSLIGLDRVSGFFPAGGLPGLGSLGVAIEPVPQASIAALRDRLGEQGVTVLDVRVESEWTQGHILGAINIPLAALESRMNEIPANDEIFVHCQGGGRSAIAASILRKHGRSEVSNLTEGFGQWERERNPVERGHQPAG